MARDLFGGELYLTTPATFSFDEGGILPSVAGLQPKKLRIDAGAFGIPKDCFVDAFPFGFVWNHETPPPEPENVESDEDVEVEDYLAILTRRMAHSFLQDDDDSNDDHRLQSWDADKAPRAVAGSPQSTLCGLPPSKKGSPNVPSLESSPPLSPVEQHCQKQQPSQEEEWDLLSRAAAQVMRQRMVDLERRRILNEQVKYRDPPKKPSPAIPVQLPLNKGSGTGYFPVPVATRQQQLQASHFYRLKQQQIMKQQFSAAWGSQGKSRGGSGEVRAIRPPGLSLSAWPPLQSTQAPRAAAAAPGYGNGMRAVFLNGARKESAGTGVFLPRTPGSKIEPRKKPACSTVLVPARVAEALNLNLEELGARSRLPHGFVINHDVLVDRTKAALSQQRTNHLQPQQPPAAADIELPPEWIY